MNIYERKINTWKPFLPLKTGGFCTTGECAQWANDNIRQVYPGVTVEFNPNTGNTTNSTGYMNEQGDFVVESQTYNPAYNQYSNYQPYRQNKPRQQKRGSGKRVKVQRIER